MRTQEGSPAFLMSRLGFCLGLLPLLLFSPLGVAEKVDIERHENGIPPSCVFTVYPTVPPDVLVDCEGGKEYADRERARATNRTRVLP